MILRSSVPAAGLLSLLIHLALLLLFNHLFLDMQRPKLPAPFTPGLVSLDIRIRPTPPKPAPKPVETETHTSTEAPIPTAAVPVPTEPLMVMEPEKPVPPQKEEQPPPEEAIGVIQSQPYPLRPITIPYPLGARQRGEEGTVRIHAILSPQGQVLHADVETSSHHRALDNAALRAMRRAQFHVPPGETEKQEVSLSFQFRLVD